MAPKIAQPYLKIPMDNSISGGIAPNRFVRNGGRFLKLGELVLPANGSISRVPIVSSWRRIKAIFRTIALVEAKNQSYIDSISSFLSRFQIYRPFRQALQISRVRISGQLMKEHHLHSCSSPSKHVIYLCASWLF
ncbi:uncharacterized protein LOC131326247 isoform X1 [Rhododendron vialii]|uniref:uncharacterized protein LOC131326247 isoform X1 n=1 Tax=Rhododendron vialii TaxID=182163 RepID=UPI00265EA9F7|nr:uncharacterized protein LOC131326247 isoform X1 [Rhododendron vialii]